MLNVLQRTFKLKKLALMQAVFLLTHSFAVAEKDPTRNLGQVPDSGSKNAAQWHREGQAETSSSAKNCCFSSVTFYYIEPPPQKKPHPLQSPLSTSQGISYPRSLLHCLKKTLSRVLEKGEYEKVSNNMAFLFILVSQSGVGIPTSGIAPID